MKYIQVHLNRFFTHTVCWVEADPRIKVGSALTFKDKEGEWTVTNVGRLQVEMKPRMDWCVGGMK